MEQEAGDGVFELGLHGGGGGAAGQGLLALAAVQGGADLADEAGGAGEGEVDLQGNGEAGALPDGLGCSGVALGHALIHDDGDVLMGAQSGQRRFSSFGHFHVHAQLRANHGGAVAGAFNSSHDQDIHPRLLIARRSINGAGRCVSILW